MDTGRRRPGCGRNFIDLKGAVALVTGGNGGLRQRICHALAKEGVRIAVMYEQSREEAEVVARELISRHQIDAAAFACDITDDAAADDDGTCSHDPQQPTGRIDKALDPDMVYRLVRGFQLHSASRSAPTLCAQRPPPMRSTTRPTSPKCRSGSATPTSPPPHLRSSQDAARGQPDVQG